MAKLPDATETEAFDEALRSADAVIADFYTPSCVICRKVEPMLAAVEQGYDGKLKAFKVNAEGNPEIAGRYGVQGVPTMILFKDGEMKERKGGFMTAKMLREWIEPYLQT
ncbi:MAG: thioredoxin family protein [Rhodospirillales bacterium]|jgi:thioredoxin 1|nr:thioredoxin family protein [Rhodospirillales bacterium]MDP6775034.1 thioredoxin family protein [Rhodospirillales bacterium]|tara:strand:- start:174 stop:503 length:330 start_codon:yes stop_codon:yes gene_type:complete